MSTSSADPIIIATINQGIKTISFNIPTKKNPILPESMELFLEHIEACKTDGTKVVIITGEGGNFSSGAMLAPEMMSDFDVSTYLQEKVNPVIMAIRESSLPFVAKVEGVCVGLGFSIALACDMLITAENAMFSQIFTRIGLSSDGGGSFFLTELLGHRKAFELIATNKNITATEALQLGIANHIYPSNELDKAIQNVTKYFASGPSIALAQVKRNILSATKGNLVDTLLLEAENQAACFSSNDFKEGVRAFSEKRAPKFKGS